MNYKRPATRTTIQYRQAPHLPDQVQIVNHFGRGIPRSFAALLRRPLRQGIPVSHEVWTEMVRKHFANGPLSRPVEVLPPKITRI